MRNLNPLHKEKLDKLFKLIPYGEENALSQSELAFILGTDERVIRSSIKKLRLEGTVIHSTGAGYFFPENEEEARSCLAFHETRYRTSARVLSRIKADLSERGFLNESN